MPHECTACGRTFADGSKEMLSGCPDCGGTKFQFRPRTKTRESAEPDERDPPADDGPRVTGREWPMHGDEPTDERRTRGRVGSRARGASPDEASDGDRSPPDEPTDERSSTHPADQPPSTDPVTTDDGIVVADEEPIPEDGEDTAQADARSGFAAPDEVAQGAAPDEADAADAAPASTDAASAPADSAPTPADAASAPDEDETPDLSALRKELNDQFESIKIVSPGQYELNLMELYEREEHIISLREDGRYVIEVPETWRSG